MTDHAAEARSWLDYSSDMNPEVQPERVTHSTALAQVHATLALADEQRTANLIALAVSGTEDTRARLIPVVMTRLGLTPTTPNPEQNR